MEVLVDQGYYEMLLDRETLETMFKVIEKAGRTCHRSESGPISFITALAFGMKMLKMRHMSILEFAIVPVKFFKISRGMTHENVRHRPVSYAQSSTRWIKKMDAGFVYPPHRDPKDFNIQFENSDWNINRVLGLLETVQDQLEEQGWGNDDRRQFYPIGISNELVVETNLREWEHIFIERTSKHAHWEIRIILVRLLKEFQEIFPGIFDHIVIAGTDKNGHPYTVIKRRVSKILEDIRNMILVGSQKENAKLLEGIINEYAETEKDLEVLTKHLSLN